MNIKVVSVKQYNRIGKREYMKAVNAWNAGLGELPIAEHYMYLNGGKSKRGYVAYVEKGSAWGRTPQVAERKLRELL